MGVRVMVGVIVEVRVTVAVAVRVAVAVLVEVAVLVGVLVAVLVAVLVGVEVMVGVAVLVGVLVMVGVSVGPGGSFTSTFTANWEVLPLASVLVAVISWSTATVPVTFTVKKPEPLAVPLPTKVLPSPAGSLPPATTLSEIKISTRQLAQAEPET